jgi:hypothetical protein
MNNRDLQRRDLEVIENDWWIPIRLTAPDKVVYDTAADTNGTLKGDARAESKAFDSEGNLILARNVTITIREAALTRIPKEGEDWFVEYPSNFLDSGTFVKVALSGNNVAVGGDTMGYIKLYPQDLEV